MNTMTQADPLRRTSLLSGRFILSLRTALLTVLALALIPAMFFAGQSRAQAHDVLVEQNPQPGEVLDTAPERIVLSFNNNLLDGATQILISNAEGTVLDDGVAEISGRDAIFEPADLDPGAYHVAWSVVSSDGHRIAGQFVFGVGAESADAVTELEASLASGDEAEHEHDDESGGDEGEHSHDDDHTDGGAEAPEADGLGVGAIVGISLGAVAVAAVVIVLFVRKAKNSGL